MSGWRHRSSVESAPEISYQVNSSVNDVSTVNLSVGCVHRQLMVIIVL